MERIDTMEDFHPQFWPTLKQLRQQSDRLLTMIFANNVELTPCAPPVNLTGIEYLILPYLGFFKSPSDSIRTYHVLTVEVK